MMDHLMGPPGLAISSLLCQLIVAYVMCSNYLTYLKKKEDNLPKACCSKVTLECARVMLTIGGGNFMAFILSVKALYLKMIAYEKFSNASESFRQYFWSKLASYSID